MSASKEIPVAGKMSGLIEKGEFVEWEATHFFVRQKLSSRITEMVKPAYFVDEMVSGAFKSFSHKHEVQSNGDGTVTMIDDFRYEVPFGIFGKMAYVLFLRKYMENLIKSRGQHTKVALENGQWEKYLNDQFNPQSPMTNSQ